MLLLYVKLKFAVVNTVSRRVRIICNRTYRI